VTDCISRFNAIGPGLRALLESETRCPSTRLILNEDTFDEFGIAHDMVEFEF
jgi:hypothetical protein